MTIARLEDRTIIRIGGEDAAHFLHNLVTTDIEHLPEAEAFPGALLTPQGKILFDFLVWRDNTGFAIEIDTDQAAPFTKRLTMYKLRAKVTIEPQDATGVTVGWDCPASQGSVTDHRFAKAGITLWRLPGASAEGSGPDAYHALRIASGIAEAGRDYPLSDAFPHDAMFDRNEGVSFRKGCYVGQEVVSRMQHRSTARRRVVVITALDGSPLPAGSPLDVEGREVGRIGSTAGATGLAIARIDRIGAALVAGKTLSTGGIAVSTALPGWSGIDFPAEAEAEA